MRWRHKLSFIIRRLIHRRRVERELDDEIRAHMEMEIEKNVADGILPEEARRAAMRSFGSVALAMEDKSQPSKVIFTGTIESSTKMTGTAEFHKGTVNWIATKK
jgi:hypothetical protein